MTQNWDVAAGHMRSAKDFNRFFKGGEFEGFGLKQRGRRKSPGEPDTYLPRGAQRENKE